MYFVFHFLTPSLIISIVGKVITLAGATKVLQWAALTALEYWPAAIITEWAPLSITYALLSSRVAVLHLAALGGSEFRGEAIRCELKGGAGT